MKSKRQELYNRKHPNHSKKQTFKHLFKKYILWIPIWIIIIVMLVIVLTGGVKV